MDVTYTIYCHTNKKNGWKYIGQTSTSVERRWGKNGNGYAPRNNQQWINPKGFWQAILDNGWDNFTHTILETNIPEDQIDEREKYWIKVFHSYVEDPDFQGGYNLTPGGGHFQGVSDETRERLRQAQLGKKASDETKKKMRENNIGEKNPFYGKHHTDETKEKLREINLGKTMDEATKEKIRQALTGTKKSEETKAKMRKPKSEEHKQHMRENNFHNKKVLCVETNEIFRSLAEAARSIGQKGGQHIGQVCRGERNICGGYHWRYIE